ncbi:ABC transporter ATP-binding protein [Vibrio sp. D404a]|uniref:ABC transporter ATP-binding protein n=1 Tax=unclassified Vibrio TaxID=2614977 RepID=UPI0025577814|nr:MULTISPECIES: ABC transporter ATP-binding protein [unclassified Vibrio]MDK9736445.1 ABC transporter ATP-binding protein [Vibrio sp. D404a]MDK9796067.1 ABC transporter ATP-binding protein [Vibrio sp. D449a]
MSDKPLGVELTNASIRYLDNELSTLQGLNLSVAAAQWTVLLGRSGCGKTTILRYLAGLLSHNIEWQGGLHTSDGEALEGRIAYMAQQDLLLPWLSVIDNVCLSQRFSGKGWRGMDNREESSEENQQRAMSLLESVGLADYAHAMPQQLSGGMRQRVALARTLMQDKPIVLMDEPFSALDAVTRHKLQTLAAKLLEDKTVVLITHDPQEAVRLAHHLYVLQGTPASAQALQVPTTLPPRTIDGQCASIQQQILEQLEQDYE